MSIVVIAAIAVERYVGVTEFKQRSLNPSGGGRGRLHRRRGRRFHSRPFSASGSLVVAGLWLYGTSFSAVPFLAPDSWGIRS
jgi:hypothetical protein